MSVKRKVFADSKFYNNFNQFNPALLLGLLIITLSLYLINWVYLKNRDLELLDEENAPDSKRGAMILMVIPFLVFFLYKVFKDLIFGEANLFTIIFGIFGLFISTILILKYLYDFTFVFGKLTRTSGFVWFFMFFLGIIGIIGFVFDLIFMKLFASFLFLTPTLMQGILNVFYKNLKLKKEREINFN